MLLPASATQVHQRQFSHYFASTSARAWLAVPRVLPAHSSPRIACHAAAFDEDPNNDQSQDQPPAPPRRQSQAPRKDGKGLGQQRQKHNVKPTPEELRAMGYDDVDDFPDADLQQQYEPLQLRESHPMYVPSLTDEQLDEDPEDHRSGYVAVIGKPNAGKSTLINAIVGQKLSIVSYKPQTTRHRIMGIASDKSYQMILFDTPGIIETKRTKLEERMMSAVVNSIQGSEAIIAVVDAKDRPQEALAMFQPASDWTGPPMAVLLNKADLVEPAAIEALSAWYKENCRAEQVFVGCALNGGGVPELKAWAVSKMPLGPTLYSKEIVSEQPERFFVAELIREKVFFLYQQEIPYSVQVNIVEFKERRQPLKDFIHAQILVERPGQVGIVIGKDGAALKRLGQEARKGIEAFLERPVYLELTVECVEGWRESKDALERFGYFDPMLT